MRQGALALLVLRQGALAFSPARFLAGAAGSCLPALPRIVARRTHVNDVLDARLCICVSVHGFHEKGHTRTHRVSATATCLYVDYDEVCAGGVILIVRVPLTQWLADAKHVIMCGVIDIRGALQEAAKNHAFGGYYGTHGLGRTDIHANRS
jgi:hypothetical protein